MNYTTYLFRTFYTRNESILKKSEELKEKYLSMCAEIAKHIMKSTPYIISQSEVDNLICTILPTPTRELAISADHLSYVCQIIEIRHALDNSYSDFYNDYCLLVANYANKINEIYSENKDYRKLDEYDIDYFFTILDPTSKEKEF